MEEPPLSGADAHDSDRDPDPGTSTPEQAVFDDGGGGRVDPLSPTAHLRGPDKRVRLGSLTGYATDVAGAVPISPATSATPEPTRHAPGGSGETAAGGWGGGGLSTELSSPDLSLVVVVVAAPEGVRGGAAGEEELDWPGGQAGCVAGALGSGSGSGGRLGSGAAAGAEEEDTPRLTSNPLYQSLECVDLLDGRRAAAAGRGGMAEGLDSRDATPRQSGAGVLGASVCVTPVFVLNCKYCTYYFETPPKTPGIPLVFR